MNQPESKEKVGGDQDVALGSGWFVCTSGSLCLLCAEHHWKLLLLLLIYLFFQPCGIACGVSVPQPRIAPTPPVLAAQS